MEDFYRAIEDLPSAGSPAQKPHADEIERNGNEEHGAYYSASVPCETIGGSRNERN